jgi:hypothetical protein
VTADIVLVGSAALVVAMFAILAYALTAAMRTIVQLVRVTNRNRSESPQRPANDPPGTEVPENRS